MKDLNLVSPEEQRAFFDSFDYVFSDIDGTIWMALETIPGADDAVRSLQKLGKTVGVTTNNTTRTFETFEEHLKSAGFNIPKENVMNQASAILHYLKKTRFNQDLFVIGMSPLKTLLKNSGFSIVDVDYHVSVDSIRSFALATIVDDDSKVGAVIYDVDLNGNYISLQMAANYLQKPNMLFLGGAPDYKGPLGKNHIMAGPGYFHRILENMSGKKPMVLAKPSKHFGQHLVDKFKIKDKSRVLIVGDSISEDMGTAANSGFKKLLVLSGLAKKKDVLTWSFPEEYKPDYYVDSLGTVHEIIQRVFRE